MNPPGNSAGDGQPVWGGGVIAAAAAARAPVAVRAFAKAVVFIAFYQLLLPRHVFSVDYSITGSLTYQSHGVAEPPGVNKPPYERQFEVLVKGCFWSIKMVPVGDPNYSYFLTTYDGSNLVYMSKLTAEAHERLTTKDSSGRTARPLFSSCVVESLPVPARVAPVGDAYAWLALASGCYFAGLTNGTALDYHPLATPSGVFSVRRSLPTRFELSPEPPYLPIRLDYMWTNRAAITPEGRVVQYDLPPPFRGGFLAAELISEQFTNVGGASFPTRFEVKEFAPLPIATNESNFRCVLVVRGSVTTISIGPPRISNGLAGEIFHVTDRRFPSSPAYLITNGVIPAASDPMLGLAENRASLRIRGMKASHAWGHGRGLWVLALGILVLLPPIYMLARAWRRTKRRTKQRKERTS
jgi:hypothetical protein